MTLHALHDVQAPAKLNLFLHVIGRRADGYHLLQSAFVLIDWCDTLQFERRNDGRLARHDLSAELPADDLCLRAARALQQAAGCTLGADISIDKQVPWGAGLGGGSSDAASTLLALNRLWDLNLPLARLMPIGLALGADVPFFLGGHNAFVEGIGEQLTPIDVPPQWFAVVKPAAMIETRAIFESPLLVRNTEAATLAGFLASDWLDANLQQNLEHSGRFGRNDLQPPAEACCAEVTEALELLRARFGNSRMTGSGSAVFARAFARKFARTIARAGSVCAAGADSGTESPPTATMPPELPAGWVGRMCRSLEIHPLAGWASDDQG